MSENELQLQRLVDGQLDRKQIQLLLGRTEQRPELWREIASAFVEDQIWKAEIGGCFSEPVSEPVATSKPVVHREAEIDKPIVASERSSVPSTATRRLRWVLSLAAATLIGLWLGNQLSDNRSNENPDIAQVHATDVSPSGVASSSEIHVNASRLSGRASRLLSPEVERVTTFKPVQHLSMGDAGQVPLYTLEDARKMGMTFANPELPKELVDQYQNLGYRLTLDTKLLSGQTKDGQQIVVPVRSFNLNLGN